MKSNYSILLLIAISAIISCNQYSYKFNDQHKKCGIYHHKISPKPGVLINNGKPTIKSQKSLRSTSEKSFKDFNIYLDKTNLEKELVQYGLSDLKTTFLSSINKCIKTLQTLLKVTTSQTNYNIPDNFFQTQGIKYWDTSKFGSSAIQNKRIGLVDLGIDLAIFVNLKNGSELGDALAVGGPFLLDDQNNGRPLAGIISLNKDTDYRKENSFEYLNSVIIHELTHVLGFIDYFFQNHFNNIFQGTDNNGFSRYYLNSPKLLEVGRKYFNCDSLKGVELEEYGQSGTVGNHWEARMLLGDYMNGAIFPEEQVISEFTLALLEDSGYYKPNYYTGGLMQYGKNKGCEFINERCVENSKVTYAKFKNEFFDTVYDKISFMDTSCTSGRQSRAYFTLYQYSQEIPEKYRHFSDKYTGGYVYADYCPIAQENTYEEGQDRYFVGSCSTKGSGNYGTRVTYKRSNGGFNFYPSYSIQSQTAEEYSDHSFCVLSSLIKKDVNDYKYYSSSYRALCYEMSCSDKSLTIKISDNYIVCPRAGGKISADNFEGYLLCPDYYLICSGTVLCNDMFDCVDKQSEVKDESYNYDYESLTNQDLNDAKSASLSEDNYELSTNGKCPQYCSQCDESGNCLKCGKNYQLVTNGNEKVCQ